MKNIVVFFGGKSCEHDISIITANQVINNIDKHKYNVYALYIDKNDNMYCDKKMFDINIYKNFDKEKNKLKQVTFLDGKNALYSISKFGKIKIFLSSFVALLCFHGGNGEDGSIQTKLQSKDIAYTSSNFLSSALCMDKIATKNMLRNDINVLPYAVMYRWQYEQDLEKYIELVLKKINFPLIIKPSKLGSSIGIKLAKNRDELIEGLILAFTFDDKVLVERAITDLKEINVSVMGLNDNIEISMLEQPITSEEILTFNEKYLCGRKNKGMLGEKRICPAKVSSDIKKTIIEYSKTAFTLLELSGIVRIDFLIDKSNIVYLNEINSIPGSLSFYLWKNKYSFSQLLDRLIEIAEQKKKYLENSKHYFESTVLCVNSGLKTIK